MARRQNTRPPSVRASTQAKVEKQRRHLLRASAILTGAALAAADGVDGDVVADAIAAGRELVDAAFDALDSVNLSHTGDNHAR